MVNDIDLFKSFTSHYFMYVIALSPSKLKISSSARFLYKPDDKLSPFTIMIKGIMTHHMLKLAERFHPEIHIEGTRACQMFKIISILSPNMNMLQLASKFQKCFAEGF